MIAATLSVVFVFFISVSEVWLAELTRQIVARKSEHEENEALSRHGVLKVCIWAFGIIGLQTSQVPERGGRKPGNRFLSQWTYEIRQNARHPSTHEVFLDTADR